MTTKRRAGSKPASSATARTRAATKRATSGRSTSTRRRTSTAGTSRTRSTRRRNSTATTLGAGVGTLVVAFLFGAPWSVKIVLAVLLVGGVGAYLLLSRRS